MSRYQQEQQQEQLQPNKEQEEEDSTKYNKTTKGNIKVDLRMDDVVVVDIFVQQWKRDYKADFIMNVLTPSLGTSPSSSTKPSLLINNNLATAITTTTTESIAMTPPPTTITLTSTQALSLIIALVSNDAKYFLQPDAHSICITA